MHRSLTPDDLKKGDVAPIGWHPVVIADYNEKDADTDGSTNCIFQFQIIDGPGKGIVANKLFNEKALGFGKTFWAVLFGPPDPVRGYPNQLETNSFKAQIGKKLEVYIKIGESNKGNKFNDIVDYRPLGAGA